MALYYIKDKANGINPVWSEHWQSTHKGDLKKERDRLNEEQYSMDDSMYGENMANIPKRFVIGEFK